LIAIRSGDVLKDERLDRKSRAVLRRFDSMSDDVRDEHAGQVKFDIGKGIGKG